MKKATRLLPSRPTHMTTTGSRADQNSHVQTLSNSSGHVNLTLPLIASLTLVLGA
jgi:hypothetical protein